MQRMIQKAAEIMVIRVNKSPALVPNALWPPMPPKAPAKPPPLPRWMSIKTIKKIPVKIRTIIRKTDIMDSLYWAGCVHARRYVVFASKSRACEHAPYFIRNSFSWLWCVSRTLHFSETETTFFLPRQLCLGIDRLSDWRRRPGLRRCPVVPVNRRHYRASRCLHTEDEPHRPQMNYSGLP
jgi:hypothetical protein